MGKVIEQPRENDNCGDDHAGNQDIFCPRVFESKSDIGKAIDDGDGSNGQDEHDCDESRNHKRDHTYHEESSGKAEPEHRLVPACGDGEEQEQCHGKSDQYPEKTKKSNLHFPGK